MPTIDIGNLDYHRSRMRTEFPDLIEGVSFDFVSPVDLNYNCLSWALSYENRYLDRGNGCYWPWDDASEETAEGWARVCEHHGFAIVPHSDTTFIAGIEKIAILRNDAGDLHATRQDATGKWKSKLGAWGPDIDHVDLKGLEKSYGRVVIVLQKSRPDWRKNEAKG
jgi:hypothetical protein